MKPMDGMNQVTDGVKQKLQEELDRLDEELRVHLPREIQKAREYGDLRENAEYKAALERQGFVKERIQQLRQRLSELSSIDLSKVPRDRAAYGSTVVLYDAEREEEVTYRLVTPEDKNIMGQGEGKEKRVTTPAGTRNFEIKKLTTLHDEVKEQDE